MLLKIKVPEWPVDAPSRGNPPQPFNLTVGVQQRMIFASYDKAVVSAVLRYIPRWVERDHTVGEWAYCKLLLLLMMMIEASVHVANEASANPDYR